MKCVTELALFSTVLKRGCCVFISTDTISELWITRWIGDIMVSKQTTSSSVKWQASLRVRVCYPIIEGVARYAGKLLAPAGVGQVFFCPSVFAYFRPVLVFSSNLSNF